MNLHRRSTNETVRSYSPMRVLTAAAVALALLATACSGSATTVDGATGAAAVTNSDTSAGTTTEAAPTAEAVVAPVPTQVPDPSLPDEFVVSFDGPGVPVADGYVAHRPVECGDELDFRQDLFDFAVPTGWNDDIGDSSGSRTGTAYQASLSRDVTDDLNILNQEFLMISIQGFINHGTRVLSGAPARTPELPIGTAWFDGEALNPLSVVAEATVGGASVPLYHSRTQGVEPPSGQDLGDIGLWQVTGTAATWPVPDATHAGRLDYRIMVAFDYARTDLPAEFQVDETQAIAIIESVQASECLRSTLIELAANYRDPYTLE